MPYFLLPIQRHRRIKLLLQQLDASKDKRDACDHKAGQHQLEEI